MRVISIVNQKGGVSKTTTAYALGAGLLRKGYKVLFIDLDGQGNLSATITRTKADAIGYSTADILTRKAPIIKAIQHLPGGDIVRSSSALIGIENILTSAGKLKEALEPLREAKLYEFIIIDTPPALNILSINALTASSGVIIPTTADIYALQGIEQLNNTIEAVKEYSNRNIRILGILLTRYSSRSILSREIAELLSEKAKQLHTVLFKTAIRECIALREAQASQLDIFTYSKRNNNAIKDYSAFTEEVLSRVM